MTVEQMAKATRDLPEFQELSKKMSQHVRLSQECMSKVIIALITMHTLLKQRAKK